MRAASFYLLSLAALAAAAPSEPQAVDEIAFACGNPPPAAEHLALVSAVADEEVEKMSGNFTVEAEAALSVNVYFHVVASAKTEAGGWVADERIQKQVTVLNDNYNSHGITFKHAGTTRTVDAAWAQGQGVEAMKAKLRQGSYDDVNIYVQPSLGGGAAGVCTLPGPTAGGPGTYATDGCQVVTASLPDGKPYNGINDGKAGVHEVGHWFGLYHTFQGGCDGDGDYVADTPAEASPPPNGGCPVGRDSCPTQSGKDPIHNHMDYTSGKCKTEFTAGQQTRMHNMFQKFRAGK
ncbi:hypothetical protein F5Y19DRAFT_484437 [Xylariaceae sp. FL1651]|nr:hypothetical protein F5Y19DRAFT_484437 [Xylariaceae sp. FL1651]